MTRLVLISPTNPDRDIPDRDGLPLGLCMIASMVRDKLDVAILDAYSLGLSVAETIDKALALEPDLVGIGLPFAFSEISATEVAGGLKSSKGDLPVIMGGIQATSRADHFLENTIADAVTLGEAERTVVDFADEFLTGGLDAVRRNPPEGLRILDANGKPVGKRRPLIENLDELPLPSLDLLPGFPSEYAARILTSRGCAFRCPYCASSGYWGHVFRAHSPARVVEEMRRLRDTWGIGQVSLADDTFNQNPERAGDIARMLIEADLGVEWGASCRPEMLSGEDLHLYVQAGMTGLFLGLESGSPRILKAIGRHHDPNKIRDLVRLAVQLGVSVHASFMIGLPDETAEDVEMTISYARGLPASSLGYHIFHPLHGSEYGDHPEKYGITWELPEGEHRRIGAIDTYAPIGTRYLSPLQIIDYYCRARAIAEERLKGG